MEESLRVKILIDDIQAKSQLKSLKNETVQTGSSGNELNSIFSKLEQTLSRITGLNFNGLTTQIANLTRAGEGASRTYQKVQKSFDKFNNVASRMSLFDKISPEGNMAMMNLWKNFTDVAYFTSSDKLFEKQRKQMGRLTKSYQELFSTIRNGDKLTSKLFKASDIKAMETGLQGALKAAHAGDRQQFIASLDPSVSKIQGILEKQLTPLEKIKVLWMDIKNKIEAIPTAVKAVAASLGLILAAVKLVKNAINVSELGDQIDKMSQKVGMSTKAYQQWAYVLERSGVQITTLQSAMRQLTRKAGDTALFSKLGIEDADKMNAQDLFSAVVSQLQQVEGSTNRARLAFQIFGEQYSELMPVLNMTNLETAQLVSNYNSLHASMSYGLVKASAELQDAITDLRLSFQGLKNTLGAAIIPILTTVIKLITKFISAVNALLQMFFGTELGQIEEPITDVVMGDIEGATDGIEQTTAAVKELKYLISGFDELNRISSVGSGGIGGAGGSFTPIGFNYDRTGFEQYQQDLKEVPGLFTNLFSDPRNSIFEGLIAPWAATVDKSIVAEWLDQNSKKLPQEVQAWAAKTGKLIGDEFEKNEWLKGERFAPDSEGAKEAGRQWATLFTSISNPITGGLNIVKGASAMYQNLIQQINEQKVEPKSVDALERIAIIVKGLPTYFNKLAQTNPKVKKLVETVKDFGDSFKNSKIGSAIDDAIKKIKESPFAQAIQSHKLSVKESLSKIFSPITEIVKGSFGKGTKEAEQGANNITKATEKGLSPIKEKVSGIWSSISGWFQQNVSPKLSKDRWAKETDKINEGIKGAGTENVISNLWEGISSTVSGITDKLFNKDTWKKKAEGIAEGVNSANINIDLSGSLDEATRKISMAEVFSKSFWQKKFGVIPEGLKNINLGDNPQQAALKIAKQVQTALNGIVWKFNNSSAFNAIAKILGIKALPYINLFANGGVITEPTLGIMGEYPGAKQNPEIITPESKLTQIFEHSNGDIVSTLVQGFRQIIQAIDQKDTTVTIGDATIAKSAARGNRQYQLQTGQSLF